MIKSPMTHARSLMTCASVVALCAVMPGIASAQSVDTGGSGQALTTGTISTSAGAVTDGGANGPVNVAGPSAVVTVDNATIASTLANSAGLNIFSTSSSGGSGVSAVFTGVNSISGTTAAVMVSGVTESASIDTTAGGGTYAGGLNANSTSGSATILNGANVITAAAGQFGLSATAGGTGAVLVNSVGGSIASGYGISASSQGGDVTVGQGGGVTTAISLSSPTGIGVTAVTSGAGNINVKTGAGGTIDGGQYGIYASNAGGSGAINVNVGAAIGGTAAPSGDAINVASGLGPISIASTASLSSQSTAIYATSTGGAISVAAGSTVTSTYGSGVYANSVGQAGATGGGAVSVGSAGQRVSGVTAGSNGIFAAGAGDVTVYAGTVSGGTRGVLAASQSNGMSDGAVLIDVNGQVTAASSYGVLGFNTGVLAGDTVSINTAGVTSTGGSGISAQSGFGDITINASGPITANAGNNSGWDGIYAAGVYSNSDFNIAINATGPVNATWNGIEADTTTASTQGAITVNATGPITAANYGVLATGAGAGAITVATTGDITAPTGGIAASNTGAGAVNIGGASGIGGVITTAGVGISGATTTGALNITTASGSSIAPGAADGIQAVSQSGAITINQGGDIGAAGANGTVGLGIDAEIQSASATSDININSNGGIYVAAGTGLQSAGIYAVNAGSGAINVTTNGVIDPGAYGVVLQGSGPVSFSATGGGVTGQIGVYAASTGTGGVSVASSAGSAIVGLAGAGVDAEGGAGGAVVNVRGSVTGATTGVIANSTGAGATVVTTGGAVVGGTTGLSLSSGAGGLNLTINGNVTAQGGPAINATSAAGAMININAGATVTGLVTAADQAVINLSTASGQSSTINVASGAVVAAASGSLADVAIRATGGSVVVNNLGQIDGTVDFSALTGGNTGTLKNAPGTVFTTSGVSNFGTGNANFANSGTLQTQGAVTTFNFGGANNVFNNTGTVVVGGSDQTAGAAHVTHAARVAGAAQVAGAGGSSFVLNNLTTFANSGALQMINGVVGDSVVMNGTAYVGSGAALLGVDTVIGAPGSASDVLIVGSSSGHTSVAIHDAAAASFGAYNPTGTVIVQGLTHPGDFTLDPSSSWYNPTLFGGALDKPGFFFSQLGVDPTSKNTVLISAPKLQAFQFATLPSQAQTIWYDTTPQPEHQGELRDQLAKADGGSTQNAPSVWFKVEGATAQRDVSQSWSGAGNSYSYDAGYSQDVTSEVAGVDAMSRTADGWGAAYGMSAGYVNSTTQFDRMQTRTQADGFTLNGYATLLRKDLFAQLTVGGDALRANLTAPLLTGYAAQTKDIASIGGSFEAGVRKPFLFGATIEPSFGLTYVQSSIGDLASAGSRFHFDDPQSLRLSLGVRLSGAAGRFDVGAWRTRYDVSLRAVDEVKGASASTLSSGGPDLPLMDNLQKQFGEVRVGLTSANQNGWSATASVRERFSAAYTDTGLTLGLRYRF